MKRLRLPSLWQCLATALLLDAAESPGVPDGSGEAFGRAETELRRGVQDGRVVGAAHLVVRDGKTLCSEAAGFGDIAERTPFATDSVLRIYSMSKPITSAAAMRLFEQGRFKDQLDGVDGTNRFGLGFAIDDVVLGSGAGQRKAAGYHWGGYASTQSNVVPEERLFQVFARQPLPYTEELAKQRFAIVYAGLNSRSTPYAAGAGAGAGSVRIPSYQTDTDISYLTGGDRTDYEQERCRLDVYYPTEQRDFSTVVWFHGGGLTGGHRSVPETLEEKGIAVVTAGYRLSPQVKSPAYIQDAAAAVAWTFRNIEKYGGATNRIFVSGHSAGGYLTSMIGLDKRWLAAHGMDANRIAGLVPLSPQAITHFTIRSERGLSDRQPIIDEMAPLFHVRKDAPPILLVTGDREKELLGRYEENAYFWRMFKVMGHPDAELIELKGYDHGQMAEPAYPLLLRFIEKHIPAGSPVESAHWNQFRGPNGQGVAPAARIPVHFGPGSNVLWKLAIPPGHSSPVIWDNHLFLTATETGNPQALLTLAIDRREGRILWRQQVQSDRPGAFHQLNNAASSTPVADAQRVYVYFGTYGILCYDHAGNQVWQRRLDTPKSKYGMATSPLLYRDTVILVQDGDDGRSRLLALHKDTGETAWEQPRPLFKAGWSTPMIFLHGAVEDLIVLGSRRLTAYDPTTGQERWWAGGFPEETVGVPVADDALLFASGAALGGRGDDHWDAAATWRTTIAEFDRNRDGQIQREEMTPGFAFIQRPELPRDNPGYGLPVNDMDVLLKIFDHDKDGVITETEWMRTMAGFAAISHPTLMALRAGAIGDARPTHVAWELRRGIPETASLLCTTGRLHLMRDGGLLTCLEAPTGRELFRERIGAPGQYIASPIAAGDRLLVASVPGVATVIQIADTLTVLARNELGEGIYATPAVAGDRLYLRTVGHLYAFGR